jgi:hypothetical protein
MRIVNTLYTLYDLENIRLFLLNLPMRPSATIPHDTIREALENDECPIQGMEPFFTLYPTLEERKKHVHELFMCFFKQNPSRLPLFCRRYFSLEHISRSLFAHLRASAKGTTFPIAEEEIGFDVTDTKHWPNIFLPLLSIWQSRSHSPADLEEAVSKWKFEAIGTLCADCPPFSLEYVLVYLLQLRLLESRREVKNPHPNFLERIAKAVQ